MHFFFCYKSAIHPCRLLLVLASLWLYLPLSAAADSDRSDPILTLTAGSFVTDFHSEVRVDSKVFNRRGTRVDFEDDLGYDKSNTFNMYQLRWDINRRHNLKLMHIPMHRRGEIGSSRSIQYDDIVINSNSRIVGNAKTDIYDLEYAYNFIATNRHRFGPVIGIHTIRWEFEFSAYGAITLLRNKITKNYADGYQYKDSLDTPLPLIGFNYVYLPNKHWRLSATGRFADLTIDEYHGAILATNFAAEYYFNNYFGLGAALTSMNVTVDADKEYFQGELVWEYSGLNAYFIARF